MRDRTMWRYFIILLMSSQLFGELNHGRLSIIPEYDRNAVTILISGHKKEALDSFLLSLPADVDSVSLIQSKSQGELAFIPLPVITKGNVKWIETPTDKSDFAIMVLTKPFKSVGHRHFDYDLQFSSSIETMDIEVQEPMGATSFNLSGFDGEKIQDPHGQTTHQAQLTQVASGKIIPIRLEYENPQGKTTRNILQEMMTMSRKASANRPPSEPIKRHKLYTWEPLIAVGVLTLLIFIVMKMNQTAPTTSTSCKNCGTRLKPTDNFCSSCGEKN